MATSNNLSRIGKMHKEEVMQRLFELFGSTWDVDAIRSAAHKHDYDLEQACNALVEELDFATSSHVKNVVDNPTNQTSEKVKKNAASETTRHLTNSAALYSNGAKSIKCGSNEKDINAWENYESTFKTSNLNPFNNISVCSKVLSKKEQEFERIVQHVRQGSKILILMRGLPGSGKSFLARQIVDRTVKEYDYSLFILTTDDYFLNKKTLVYEYQPHKLQEAHEWNQHRAYNQMSAGVSPIIIDNTNTQLWELKSYTMIAVNFGYIIEILEPFTSWAFDEKQLALKNKHGVPKVKIADMRLRYERNITPTKILDTYQLAYLNQIPPVPRNFPPIRHNISSLAIPENRNLSDTCQSTIETFDLIGFDDSQSPIYVSDDSVNESYHKHIAVPNNTNLMDSILEDSNINKSNVLTPHNLELPSETKKLGISDIAKNFQLDNHKAKVKDDNKIVKQIEKAKHIYPSLNLSSWGLSENALASWESWDVVTPLSDTHNTKNFLETDMNLETPKVVETSHSSTNTSSYDFALLSNRDLKFNEDIKIINTACRDINIGATVTPPCSPPKKALLDKSSMTIDFLMENKESSNENEELEDLKMLFTGIPFTYLRDVYEKCNKNIHWTVDLLLDDKKEILPSVHEQFVVENGEKVNRTLQIISKLESDANPTKHESPASNEKVNTELMEIKKHIEDSIEINKDLYSDHIMKIKHSKHKTTSSKSRELPSTSTFPEIVSISSSVDINDFESDILSPSNEDGDEDSTVEINLGDACISQLETIFGFPENFPRGFLPVVQIPHELAEQLYAFYVQSVVIQMEAQSSVLDTIVREDEELAKKLQMQEHLEEDCGRKTPDLNEIMKDQAVGKMYSKEADEWKKLTPDTLAAKLTIQKLANAFPSLDVVVLQEILHAHNNSYEDTIEVLLNSTAKNNIHDPQGTIRDPPISEPILNEMRMANEEKKLVENIEDVSKNANEYRDEANGYYKKHNDYMQKAQRAFQSKQYPVAQFYSNLAKSYTQLYEHTNSLAAIAFLDEHSKKLQNFQTLDLHYLYVKEALPALDIFLDRNIRLLNGTCKNKETLFIITGRGKRSGGKSRLKPAVMSHLRKRGFKFVQLNPGLLKVTIYPHSSLTSNVQQ